ncbi:MAG: glutamine-hydrolyzing carbamoyl-phosphate synthase small subunit [Firmicutes bacterium]|nr:glutamine-hydrolyzing carbamoyl-phosphate synthase small subunit [Bacillota bacterium]
MKAILVLEDGFTLEGRTFVGSGEIKGEVVFNTSMTGYQEIITDPSYKGQMVVMTYPLIGNYGINIHDNESKHPQVEAFIVKEYCEYPHNWQSEGSLKDYLEKHNIIGLEGIDTRALTRHIRQDGAMKGIISTIDDDIKNLNKKVNNYAGLVGKDMVKYVSCKKEYQWNKQGKYHVAAIDYGIKHSILKMLEENNCQITVVPASTSAESILNKNPDGVFLSNGPGDPAAVPYAVKEVKKLLGKKPIFGICFGQQILGQALGLSTYKLKFGHRGGNHPVKNLINNHVEISTQNHGFCVELPDKSEREKMGGYIKDLEITHINLNDNTLEGFRHPQLNCFSIQYHPEAAPGPHDSHYLFKDFVKLMSDIQ